MVLLSVCVFVKCKHTCILLETENQARHFIAPIKSWLAFTVSITIGFGCAVF